MRIQYATEPVSLDPALAEDGAALRILGNTMEGLVGYDENGHLVPRLASAYRISNGGRRFEFTLRPDAKWSDGKPVLPQDFITAFRRIFSPSSRTKLNTLLLPIRGAQALREGKGSDQDLGVLEENGKLIIELDKRAPYFIQSLALPSALPVREDILKTHEGEWPEKAPSTGPYTLTEHIPDRKIYLKINPNYYGTKGLDIELIFVADESTALNLFEKGRLDILTKIPSFHLAKLRKMGVLVSDPYYAVYYLAFQTRKAPFDSRDWRRAVSGSIRREEILKAMDSGDAPALSWLPHGIEGSFTYHREQQIPKFQDSVDKIQKITRKKPYIDLIPTGFDNTHRNSTIMEKVQEDLFRSLHLKLALQRLDWKNYVRTLQTDAPALFRFGWQAPILDPLPLLNVFTSNDPNNYTRWKNKEYDTLVEKIATLEPGPARLKLIQKAQDLLVFKEAVVVPIFHYVQLHCISKSIQGFKANPFGIIRFDQLKRQAVE